MEQTASERTVRCIPATKPRASAGRNGQHGKQRVAAYCRVSTDSEEQINSYTAQKAYYSQKLRRPRIGRWLVCSLMRGSREPA